MIRTLFHGIVPHFAAAHHTGYWDFVKSPPGLQSLTQHFQKNTDVKPVTLQGRLHDAPDGHVHVMVVNHPAGPYVSVLSHHDGKTKISRIYSEHVKHAT